MVWNQAAEKNIKGLTAEAAESAEEDKNKRKTNPPYLWRTA